MQLIEEPLESERDTLILVVALSRHLVHCLQWSIHRHTSYYTMYLHIHRHTSYYTMYLHIHSLVIV